MDALTRQWKYAIERQNASVAALRADLYNTSAKQYDRTFEAADFMPGAKPNAALEARVNQLVEQGFTRSQAAAIACSSNQTNEQKLRFIDAASLKSKRKRRA